MSAESDYQSQERNVIVVLGVGRSGTSLAMQALESMGMRVSKKVIPANVSNPKGFYEDADIVEIHKILLNALAPTPAMPLREGWENAPITQKKQQALKEHVERHVEAGPGIWGFKDPRTATFLPIWIRIFNQLKIVPRFVLAMRGPEAIIQSLSQQYGNDQAFAELVFLLRTLDALYHTGGNCHVLQYEQWFSAPQETMKSLRSFAFGKAVSPGQIDPPVVDLLNRTGSAHIEIQSPLVKDLHQKLVQYARGEVKHEGLMQYVYQLRLMLRGFSPWVKFADNQKKQRLTLEEEVKGLREISRKKEQAKEKEKSLKLELGRRDQAVDELLHVLGNVYK